MITKYYRTPEEDFASAKLSFERSQPLWERIMSTFPKDITAQLSSDPIGEWIIRMFIHMPDASEADLRRALQWMREVFQREPEKGFRPKEGQFFYRVTETNGKSWPEEITTMVFIETKQSMNCKIVPREQIVTVFESVCEEAAE